MGEEIPRWAIERALAELGSLSPYATVSEVLHYAAEPICNRYARQVLAFARYIAEHEEPPVDPLLIEAREMFAERHKAGANDIYWHGAMCKYGAASEAILAGEFDAHGTLLILLSALRRGMELGREQSK